jgi:hypothetical protein
MTPARMPDVRLFGSSTNGLCRALEIFCFAIARIPAGIAKRYNATVLSNFGVCESRNPATCAKNDSLFYASATKP